MGFEGDLGHLTSEQIQEFLDRQLTRDEEALVKEHLAACVECQCEVETWGLLFSDLGTLPELDPSPVFLQEVLRKAPVREPVGDRARGWLAARKARKHDEAHIPTGSIQDYLENLLPAQPAARLETHLSSCASCRSSVQGWRKLLGSLPALEHFAPGSGFSERVMAQVMVPAPVPIQARGFSSLPGRAMAWARRVLPQTRHGWAVAGGVASAPTITMVALVYLVFSRPLLTPGAFGSYLSWKASTLFNSLVSTVSSLVMESGTLSRFLSILEPIARSPFLLGVGGLVFSLVSACALWVLYRNLIVTPPDNRYARARV